MLDYRTIRRIRECNNISQKKLADYLQCNKKYISNVETNNKTYTEEQQNKILNAIYTLAAQK